MMTNTAIATRRIPITDGGLAKLKERVKYLEAEIERITMLTERRKKVLGALRSAMASYGYDLDAVMADRCRERTLVDLRSIAWSIYKNETDYSCQQVAEDFGWNRATVFCAIRRADDLRGVDRNFADMYDSLHKAFTNAISNTN